MAEYIEREEVLQIVGDVMSDCKVVHKHRALNRNIKQIPTADVAEVRRGKWIGFDNEKVPIINGCPTCSCLCSLCGDWLSASDEYFVKGNYCPNCGAKMDLE